MEQLLVVIAPMVASWLTGMFKKTPVVDAMSKPNRVWWLRILLAVFSIGYIFLTYLLTGNLDQAGLEIAVEGVISALVAMVVYQQGKKKVA